MARKPKKTAISFEGRIVTNKIELPWLIHEYLATEAIRRDTTRSDLVAVALLAFRDSQKKT